VLCTDRWRSGPYSDSFFLHTPDFFLHEPTGTDAESDFFTVRVTREGGVVARGGVTVALVN
jgi:hypothetical protein